MSRKHSEIERALLQAGLTLPAIDAHADVSYRGLPDEVTPATHTYQGRQNGIASAILVQQQIDPDEAVSMNMCDRFVMGIAGVVAAIDIAGADACRATFEAVKTLATLKGFRSRWTAREAELLSTSRRAQDAAGRVAASGRTLVLTSDGNLSGLRSLPRILEQGPLRDVRAVVISNLGTPRGTTAGRPEVGWVATLDQLASDSRVFLDLAGCRTSANANVHRERFLAFYDAALEAFSPKRLLFGTAWSPPCRYEDLVGDIVGWMKERELSKSIENVANAVFRESAVAAFDLI